MNSSKCSPNLHGKYCDSQALQLIKIVRNKKGFESEIKKKDDVAIINSINIIQKALRKTNHRTEMFNVFMEDRKSRKRTYSNI